MKTLISVLIAMAFISGCTDKQKDAAKCKAQDLISTAVAAQVAAELSCKKQDVIKAQVEAKADKNGTCAKAEAPAPAEAEVAAAASAGPQLKSASVEAEAKFSIGKVLCEPVIDALLAEVQGKIPAEWECDPSAKVDDLKAKVLASCEKAL